MLKPNRFAATVAGTLFSLLCLLFENSADASNGYAFVAACSCATTQDFINAARATATSNAPQTGPVGVYTTTTFIMVSHTTARTAYILVTGGIQQISGRPARWVITAIGPVDAKGVSIAGDTESAQEAIYNAIDTNLMMSNRSDPIVTIGLQLPGFFSHDDAEISAAYFNNSVTDASNLGTGATVTLTWGDGSGVVAVYTVVWLGTDHNNVNNFALKWVSSTQNGKPITRSGAPLNANPPGGKSSGTVLVGGFGPGASWTWSGAGDASTPGVTITVGDPQPVEDFPPTDSSVPVGP